MVTMFAAPVGGGGSLRNQSEGFSAWVEGHLARRGLNASEFALAVGVSPSTVSRWRSGWQPDARHIPRIARVSGANEIELFRLAGYTTGERVGEEELSPAKRRVIELFRSDDVEITPEWLRVLESLAEEMRRRPGN